MNRGSQPLLVDQIPIGVPSMRPRFMNRGSAISRARADARSSSFNEAPIHESGKWASEASTAPPPCSAFNEAPIHESGKCRHFSESGRKEVDLQ